MTGRQKRVLAGATLIVLLVICVAVIIELTNRFSDQHSGTATTDSSTTTSYSNPKVGLQIQLPSDWHPHEITTPSGSIQIVTTAPVDNPDPQITISGETLTFTIWNSDNAQEGSLEDWAIQEVQGPGGPAQRQYVTINGHLALQLEFYDDPVSITAVDVGSKRYFIAAQSLTAPYSQDAPLFQQVTSSIQFSP
jgi:hypothetical protein